MPILLLALLRQYMVVIPSLDRCMISLSFVYLVYFLFFWFIFCYVKLKKEV